MKDIIFSIIVPVYNTEKYLTQCIESVLLQGYNSFELILVNDGSVDASASICEMYARQDSRIIYIDKKNGGVSSARNAGLNAASGEFLLFLDSDDWMCKDLLENAMGKIRNNAGRDIYIGDYINYNEKNGTTQKQGLSYQAELFEQSDPAQLLAYLFWEGTSFFTSCRSIYKRSIMKESCVLFDETLTSGEDCDYFIRFIMKCNSFGYIDIPLFYYRIEREGSASVKPNFSIVISWLTLSKKWFTYFYSLFTKSEAIYMLKIANRFANQFLDGMKFMAILSKSERMEADALFVENDYILHYTRGKKHFIAKMIYRCVGFHVAALMLYYLYRVNAILGQKWGSVWKSEYATGKPYSQRKSMINDAGQHTEKPKAKV